GDIGARTTAPCGPQTRRSAATFRGTGNGEAARTTASYDRQTGRSAATFRGTGNGEAARTTASYDRQTGRSAATFRGAGNRERPRHATGSPGGLPRRRPENRGFRRRFEEFEDDYRICETGSAWGTRRPVGQAGANEGGAGIREEARTTASCDRQTGR